MKPLFIPLTLCFMLLFACKQSTNTSSTNVEKTSRDTVSKTKIKFIRKWIDFGVHSNDTILLVRYPFINTGKRPLIVKGINPDCTCTDYMLSQDTIAPADTAFLQLEFNTRGKSGFQKNYTIVKTNTRPKFSKLTFTAKINPVKHE